MDKTIWDLAVDETIRSLLPNKQSTIHRKTIFRIIQDTISSQLKLISDRYCIFMFGSVPLRTYLSEGDIDICLIYPEAEGENWISMVENSLLDCSRKNSDTFAISDIVIVNADIKVVKCFVGNVAVDISVNQTSGIYTLYLCERVDRLVGRNHLFKRSVILVKAWMRYEAHILQSSIFLLSTYAVEVMIMYILNMYSEILFTPLQVLLKFLNEFSTFDWRRYGISYAGPIRLSKLPEISIERGSQGSFTLITKEFVEELENPHISDYPESFIPKHINIVDPLCQRNNLGRSVSLQSFGRIKDAFRYYSELFRSNIFDCVKILEFSMKSLQDENPISGALKEKTILQAADMITRNLFPSVLEHSLSPRNDETFPQPRHLGGREPRYEIDHLKGPNSQMMYNAPTYSPSTSAPMTPVFGSGTPQSMYSPSMSPRLSPIVQQFMAPQQQAMNMRQPVPPQVNYGMRTRNDMMAWNTAPQVNLGGNRAPQPGVGKSFTTKIANQQGNLKFRVGNESAAHSSKSGANQRGETRDGGRRKAKKSPPKQQLREKEAKSKPKQIVFDLTKLKNAVDVETHPLTVGVVASPREEKEDIDENSFLIDPPDNEIQSKKSPLKKAKEEVKRSESPTNSVAKTLSSQLLSSLHFSSSSSKSSTPAEKKAGEKPAAPATQKKTSNNTEEGAGDRIPEASTPDEEMFEMKEMKQNVEELEKLERAGEEGHWEAVDAGVEDIGGELKLQQPVQPMHPADVVIHPMPEAEFEVLKDANREKIDDDYEYYDVQNQQLYGEDEFVELIGDVQEIESVLGVVDELRSIIEIREAISEEIPRYAEQQTGYHRKFKDNR